MYAHRILLGCYAPLNDTNERSVNNIKMIAIDPIFGLQFPIAVVGIVRAAAYHFESLRCLIDQHVDKHTGFAQVCGERV